MNASTPPMTSPWRPVLVVLYAVSGLAGLAVGLYNPLIAVLMKQGGYTETAIGATSSLFFLCVILAAPGAGHLARRVSMRLTLAAGLLLSGAISFLFPFATSLLEWSLLRGALGIGIGLYLIGGQSAVNAFASDDHRSVVSGLHALAFGLGMGIGPLLGAGLFAVSTLLAFLVCGLVMWLAAAVVLRGLPVEVARPHAPLQWAQVRAMSLSLHAVFAYGVAEATLMGLFPVFMLDRGHSMATMSLAFSAFVIGGIASTLPLTRLADRIGPERVLGLCAFTGVIGSMAMVWTPVSWIALLSAALTGASLGPVFALALAIVGRLLPREDLPSGSAWFTAAFGVGSMFAPWLAALIMREFGSIHIFTLSTLLFASLLLRLFGTALPVRRLA